MSFIQLFLSVIVACGEKENDSQIQPNNTDCGEWGDCYGECMEPYSDEYIWTVPAADFSGYLDEAGQLSSATVFALLG